MIKNKFLLLAMLLVLFSLFVSACSFKTEKSESYTDKDGNTVTTTTTNDNGKVTTDTTASSGDEEEYDDEEEYADEEESTDTPTDVTSFVESLNAAIAKYGIEISIGETVDRGDGKYAISTDSELVTLAVLTDGSTATEYTINILGEDKTVIDGMYALLIAALLEGDEMDAVYEAIVTDGEAAVMQMDYQFTAVSGESDGIPFSLLSARVN